MSAIPGGSFSQAEWHRNMVTLIDGAMQKETRQELIDQTKAAWQSRSPVALTREDARDILTNTASLLELLMAWDQEARTHND